MLWVPVISSTEKPLMPCHPARARELVRNGRAIRRFDRGLFYIKLLDRQDGETQPVVLGLDPGSKKEGYTVKSSKHTFLNIQADAVIWVKEHVETRAMLRRLRRQRKTPYRKWRGNRNQGKFHIPPSTRARWGWKLRVINWISRRYPVSMIVVEDIKAESRKGCRKWNKSFSPLEVGKNWFYSEVMKLCTLRVKPGYETFQERERLGLVKSRNKMSSDFSAHCVDSWVLANMFSGGHAEPENTQVTCLIPIRLFRRRLHKMILTPGGIRKREGGSVSLGWKRGTWVKHSKWGVCYVGGWRDGGGISLHDLKSRARIARVKSGFKFLCLASWRFVYSGGVIC